MAQREGARENQKRGRYHYGSSREMKLHCSERYTQEKRNRLGTAETRNRMRVTEIE